MKKTSKKEDQELSPFIRHPLMRVRNEQQAAVTFSELLFDLICVFAVTQLSHYLLHHLNWTGVLQQTLIWFAVWLAWQHTVWITNWFDPETKPIRFLLFALMLLGLVVAASIPEAFTTRAEIFAASYVVLQMGRALCILLILGNHHLSNNYKRILGWACISAVFWLWGAFGEESLRLPLWAVAVLCDYLSPMFGFYLPFLGRSNPGRDWNVEGHHLTERCQLFVIIAFGESILMTGASLSSMDEWTSEVLLAAFLSFVNSLAMWWIYFDVSSEQGSEKIRRTSNPGQLGLKYQSIHVILVGALIWSAVGDELTVSHPHDHTTHSSAFVLIIGPIIYLLSNMIYKWMINQTVHLSHVIAIGLFLLLIPYSYRHSLLWVNCLSVGVFVFVIVYELIRERRKGQNTFPETI